MIKASYIILALTLSLAIFGLAKSSEAACTGSSPTWISSADSDSLNSCISQATAGDTVNVQAGSFSWSGIISKHISIIGGYGGGTTSINNSGTIEIDPDRTGQDTLLRVSNFTFNCGNSNPCIFLGDYQLSYSPGFIMMYNVRFDHNTLTNLQNYAMKSALTFYGVVDHNRFGTSMNDKCGTYCMWNETEGGSGTHDYWKTSPQNEFQLGSKKYIYYEDNVFYSSVRVVVNQWASRGVFRYNTVYESGNAEFEIHGCQDPTYYQGGFGYEIYGNHLIGSNGAIANIRSGEDMVYYNNVSAGNPSIQVYCDSATTCASYQPALQMTHGNYYWQNRRNYTGVTETAGDNGYTCNWSCGGNLPPVPQAGRDYFNSDTSSGHTAPSVGCGTLANLPGTCTAGQGYWATNQSCANLTGMVGTNPASPISGTLYKCTSTNTWTAYYTPYSYPHPLTLTSSSVLYGDVSGDSTISAYDASLAAQYAVNLIALTPTQITAADVSGDGTVSAYDASLIAQKAVGLITKFPVQG